MTTFWLSIHADYACRHSGACCTSRWPIPVERSRARLLEEALARGALVVPGGAFARPRDLPEGVGAVLRTTRDGDCVFYDAAAAVDRCAVHRALGHGALPSSCRHFPRVCLADRRGVSVTLSHYCPTVAATPFRRDRPLEIVEGPEPVPGEPSEGLDARETLPPLLSPEVLMDHEAYARWERLVVRIFADDGDSAEGALDRVASTVEELRRWVPGGPALDAAVASLEEAHQLRRRGDVSAGREFAGPDRASFDEVRACVPAPYTWDPAPATSEPIWGRFAGETWMRLARPVRFYLAAKAFASWVAYQGQGLRTIVRSLRAALCVLQVESLRLAAKDGAVLDADLLQAAMRRADLLLLHLADRSELARVWSAAERSALRRRPEA